MKKVLSLALALAMMATMLVGCGDSGSAASSTPATSGSAATSSSTPSSSEPVNVLKVDVASVYTDGACVDSACLKFTEILNESGLFEATYYNNGQLGNANDMFESIISGDYVIGIGGGSDWGGAVGIDNLGIVMTPFLYDELEDVFGITESDIWADLLEQASTNGVKMLNSPVISGSRYLFTKAPVSSPNELAGMKLRVPTSTYYVNAMQAFGATPTAIALNDLYSSLAQGVVDGCEQPYADANLRQLYEVCGYASDFPYVTTYDFYGCSTELWDVMSDEQKAVLESAAAEASACSFEIFTDLEAASKQALSDAGIQFCEMDVEAFRACMETFYDLCGWTEDFKAAVTGAMDTYRASK